MVRLQPINQQKPQCQNFNEVPPDPIPAGAEDLGNALVTHVPNLREQEPPAIGAIGELIRKVPGCHGKMDPSENRPQEGPIK